MNIKPIATGTRFGNLIVQSQAPTKDKKLWWNCLCDCGNQCVVSGIGLRAGNNTTCGARLHVAERFTKHGMYKSPTYYSWGNMVARCVNPKATAFKDYGGRGVTVCECWLKFENFLADMGECPPGLTIDRKNNNGNYEPGNCRWVDRSTQQLNRRNCIFDGAIDRVKDLRRFGYTYAAIATYLGLRRGTVWGLAHRA